MSLWNTVFRCIFKILIRFLGFNDFESIRKVGLLSESKLFVVPLKVSRFSSVSRISSASRGSSINLLNIERFGDVEGSQQINIQKIHFILGR